jgi:hypothetical protein
MNILEKPKYTIIRLSSMISVYADNEKKINEILSTFDCVNNMDVDKFFKEKAVEFDKQGISKTHIVTTSYRDKQVIVGYFTLCNKSFVIKNNSRSLTKTARKRLSKFAQYDAEANLYIMSAPLIGQLGKNDNYRKLITGDDLLAFACDMVKKVQISLGGRYVYLECEDKPKLIDFYSDNGFVNFGRRELESDEKDDLCGKYLIQMLKYLK